MTDSGECRGVPLPISTRTLAFHSGSGNIVFFDTERGDVSARTAFGGGSFCFHRDKLIQAANGTIRSVDCPYLSQDNGKNYLPYYKDVKDEFFGLIRD